jgi:hypothetical protein
VPNSRINSWETWFIFNLRRRINKLVTHPAYYILCLQWITDIMTLLYIFIHTWVAIPPSTSQIRPSWPPPWFRLSPSLAHTYLTSSLFVLAHPVACCLSLRFIFHTYNPPFTTRRLNTFIQLNIMVVRYNIYNWHICSLQLFFLMPLLDLWAGQLASGFHVENMLRRHFNSIFFCFWYYILLSLGDLFVENMTYFCSKSLFFFLRISLN